MALPAVQVNHKKNSMRTIYIITALTLSLACVSASAQQKSYDTTARYFIIQASVGNLQEIAAGRLAASQAADPQVKAFGQRMIDDHTKAEAQLMQLIKTRGFQIPPEATNPPVTDPMLQEKHGAEFDKLYVHMMIPDHRQTVNLFSKYALTGKDPDVRAFAQQVLPTLKEHLAAIMAIDNSMNSTTMK